MRWLLIGLGVLLVIQFLPKFFGGNSSELQPLRSEGTVMPSTRRPERKCEIWTPSFHATLSSRGASLKHFYLLQAKYRHAGKPIDLSTTPDVEMRRQLRVSLRNEAVAGPKDPSWQIDFDEFDWNIEKSDSKTCVFSYRDKKVALRKTISTTARPYELSVTTEITNLDKVERRHALVVDTAAWRSQAEVHGKMFRVSPFLTHVECVGLDGKAKRLQQSDFKADEFKGPNFAAGGLNPGDWFQASGGVAVAAVSNAYFTDALVPQSAPDHLSPVCQLQVEDRWDPSHYKKLDEDPKGGSMYRARLAYPAMELAPDQSASYTFLSFVGPKERKVLAEAGGGATRLSDLIDLGFFSAIAKILVGFLLTVHQVIPNWGLAIIILTLTARLLLFPLAIPSIKNMVKMRELKPEIDALNARFKDDAQAKGLAQMELWRKHKVNPLKGCLPQLASMPVWFALYTTLQTAVELYNIPFLWFPDLSLPDPYFVLPFVIGGTSFLQQKMMPMQGDAAQQKMMLYLMPGMFTVFMLFLPSGLGVYMFTNGVLGILQQQVVERHARRTLTVNPPSTHKDVNATESRSSGKIQKRRTPSAKGKA